MIGIRGVCEMNLLEILDQDLIDMELEAKSKDDVIKSLSTMLYKKGNIKNLDKFIEAIYERESIGETGMGNHIAIPHGLTQEVLKASVAIGKVKKPVAWESLDDEPVELIFLIAASTDELEKTHLQMLAQLASVLAYKEHVDGLLECQNNESFLKLFKSYFDDYTRKREQMQ